jgi:hypothetical protein
MFTGFRAAHGDRIRADREGQRVALARCRANRADRPEKTLPMRLPTLYLCDRRHVKSAESVTFVKSLKLPAAIRTSACLHSVGPVTSAPRNEPSNPSGATKSLAKSALAWSRHLNVGPFGTGESSGELALRLRISWARGDWIALLQDVVMLESIPAEVRRAWAAVPELVVTRERLMRSFLGQRARSMWVWQGGASQVLELLEHLFRSARVPPGRHARFS